MTKETETNLNNEDNAKNKIIRFFKMLMKGIMNGIRYVVMTTSDRRERDRKRERERSRMERIKSIERLKSLELEKMHRRVLNSIMKRERDREMERSRMEMEMQIAIDSEMMKRMEIESKRMEMEREMDREMMEMMEREMEIAIDMDKMRMERKRMEMDREMERDRMEMEREMERDKEKWNTKTIFMFTLLVTISSPILFYLSPYLPDFTSIHGFVLFLTAISAFIFLGKYFSGYTFKEITQQFIDFRSLFASIALSFTFIYAFIKYVLILDYPSKIIAASVDFLELKGTENFVAFWRVIIVFVLIFVAKVSFSFALKHKGGNANMKVDDKSDKN